MVSIPGRDCLLEESDRPVVMIVVLSTTCVFDIESLRQGTERWVQKRMAWAA